MGAYELPEIFTFAGDSANRSGIPAASITGGIQSLLSVTAAAPTMQTTASGLAVPAVLTPTLSLSNPAVLTGNASGSVTATSAAGSATPVGDAAGPLALGLFGEVTVLSGLQDGIRLA